MNSTIRQLVSTAVEDSLERIRQHPFILRANEAVLSKEQVTRWIMCAGRESRSFPLILERMIGHSQHPVIKEALQRNLDDEYGHGNPQDVHFHHYLHLLDAIGIDRAEFDRYEQRSGIELALSLAYNIADSKDEGLALGYMLVNEGMTQITYSAVRAALGRYYGQLSVPFFEIHVAVDEQHVEELYQVADQLPLAAVPALLFGVGIGERGMAVLLDEAYGVYDHVSLLPAFTPVTLIAA